MHNGKLIFALGLFNVAIFVLVALFLPRNASFGSSGPISYFINARADWHIAFGVLIASLLISCGVYLLANGFKNNSSSDDA